MAKNQKSINLPDGQRKTTGQMKPQNPQVPVLWHQTSKRAVANGVKVIKKGLLFKLPLFIVLILLAVPVYYAFHNNGTGDDRPKTINLQTTEQVVRQVSKHILLPSGEQPTVATVTDASKVRNQAFFANAASGDKVLVYAQAKKAYLYRPSIDRVIEVAPLAPNDSGDTGQ